MPTTTERRAAARCRLPLTVAAAGTPAELVDLSAGGLAVAATGLGDVGATVEVVLPLPDRAPALVARAHVVRTDGTQTALRLSGLTPDEHERIDRFALRLARSRSTLST
jgi:hypothetical protein